MVAVRQQRAQGVVVMSPITSRCQSELLEGGLHLQGVLGSILTIASLWPHSSYILTPSPHCGVDCGVMA